MLKNTLLAGAAVLLALTSVAQQKKTISKKNDCDFPESIYSSRRIGIHTVLCILSFT